MIREIIENINEGSEYYFQYNPEQYGKGYGQAMDWIHDWNNEDDLGIRAENSGDKKTFYVIGSDKKVLKKVAGWMDMKNPSIDKYKG